MPILSSETFLRLTGLPEFFYNLRAATSDACNTGPLHVWTVLRARGSLRSAGLIHAKVPQRIAHVLWPLVHTRGPPQTPDIGARLYAELGGVAVPSLGGVTGELSDDP